MHLHFLYILLILRPYSRMLACKRAISGSNIQIVTFQNNSGIFYIYSNSNSFLASVLIVSSFGPNGNVSICKNLMHEFSLSPSYLVRSPNKLQTLKKCFIFNFFHSYTGHYFMYVASNQQFTRAVNTIAQRTVK